MLPSSEQVKKIAGTITFSFENLPVWTDRGEERRFGIATFAYDGVGSYWPIALTLEAKTFGALPRSITYGAGPVARSVPPPRALQQPRTSRRASPRISTCRGMPHGAVRRAPARPAHRSPRRRPTCPRKSASASLLIGASRAPVSTPPRLVAVVAAVWRRLPHQPDRPARLSPSRTAIVATLEAGGGPLSAVDPTS